jgi:uncharacterized membrane protein
LSGYRDIDPGLPNRIVAMAEGEQKHRHEMESEVVKRTFDEGARGQHYALVIGIIAIISGAVTAVVGSQLAGGFIGGAGVIGLVAVFIYGRQHGSGSGPEDTQPKTSNGKTAKS